SPYPHRPATSCRPYVRLKIRSCLSTLFPVVLPNQRFQRSTKTKMRLSDVIPLAFLGTFAAATMDVAVIANSCAGVYFEQAMKAPGNPCPVGNYDCVCGAGFSFMEQYLIQALSQNPGACPGNQLMELQDKARMACGGGAGGGGMPAPGATTPPVTTPIQTPPVTPVVTPNVTVPTGIFPPPGGNVTPPAGTPTSPSVFTGAAATAAIGQFVGAAGVAAAAVAFGL
ncbi:hypothetical protein IWZ00DRAFT_155813, partial [Phyllosticta capitalensis]